MIEHQNIDLNRLYRLPDVFMMPVSQDISCAYHPLTGALAVFDADTAALLQAFRQPARLADGIRQVGDWPEAWQAAQQLVHNGLLVAADAPRVVPRAVTHTLTAWLHLTETCNLACRYCYVQKHPAHMSQQTGQAALKMLFQGASAHGYHRVKLKYAGGEPGLRFPHLLSLHRYATRLANEQGQALSGVVLTNGVGWTAKMVDQLAAQHLQVMVSLDGLGLYHDRQRLSGAGAPSFDSVLSTLNLLDQAGIAPFISVTISRQNLPGLPELTQFLLERGYRFHFNFLRQNGTIQNGLAASPDALMDGLGMAYRVIERGIDRGTALAYPLTGALLDRVQLRVPHERPCGACRSYVVIGTQGELARCHMDLAHPLSSINEVDPIRAITGPEQAAFNPTVEEKPVCATCAWRYACAGGCPMMARPSNAEDQGASPYCSVYRQMIPQILRLEALRMVKSNSDACF